MIVCVAIAIAVLGSDEGEASASLQWVEVEAIPESRLIEIPDSFGHEMGISDPELRATGLNAGGESLFATAATLWMDAGSPIVNARARCSIKAPRGAELAQTQASHAAYPRPAADLADLSVPALARVRFATDDADLAAVQIGELIGDRFSTEREVGLEWPSGSAAGEQRFEWVPAPEPPGRRFELRFAAIWKTGSVPAAKITCSLTTGGETVTLRTSGALPKRPRALAEDAE